MSVNCPRLQDIPHIGLGTFKSRGSDVKSAVRCALEHGIRHIDTASVYKVSVHSSCNSVVFFIQQFVFVTNRQFPNPSFSTPILHAE